MARREDQELTSLRRNRSSASRYDNDEDDDAVGEHARDMSRGGEQANR